MLPVSLNHYSFANPLFSADSIGTEEQPANAAIVKKLKNNLNLFIVITP